MHNLIDQTMSVIAKAYALTFRRFCRGYRPWNTLTRQEIEVLPWLIRLRMVTSALWWLGRMSEHHLLTVFSTA